MSSTTKEKPVYNTPLTELRYSAIEERDEIIKIATQKSKNNTLTLEESNRLLEQFNETLRTIAEQRNVIKDVDESWALELIKEYEDDEVIIA